MMDPVLVYQNNGLQGEEKMACTYVYDSSNKSSEFNGFNNLNDHGYSHLHFDIKKPQQSSLSLEYPHLYASIKSSSESSVTEKRRTLKHEYVEISLEDLAPQSSDSGISHLKLASKTESSGQEMASNCLPLEKLPNHQNASPQLLLLLEPDGQGKGEQEQPGREPGPNVPPSPTTRMRPEEEHSGPIAVPPFAPYCSSHGSVECRPLPPLPLRVMQPEKVLPLPPLSPPSAFFALPSPPSLIFPLELSETGEGPKSLQSTDSPWVLHSPAVPVDCGRKAKVKRPSLPLTTGLIVPHSMPEPPFGSVPLSRCAVAEDPLEYPYSYVTRGELSVLVKIARSPCHSASASPVAKKKAKKAAAPSEKDSTLTRTQSLPLMLDQSA